MNFRKNGQTPTSTDIQPGVAPKMFRATLANQ
jgi:hypothetical protein